MRNDMDTARGEKLEEGNIGRCTWREVDLHLFIQSQIITIAPAGQCKIPELKTAERSPLLVMENQELGPSPFAFSSVLSGNWTASRVDRIQSRILTWEEVILSCSLP